jgi:geranylgeranyl reductase family protein
MANSPVTCQVAIVGSGPAGAACAYWLALRDIEVTAFDKKVFPRDKTCGDGLTPRSVVALEAMGLGRFLSTKHRYNGLRVVAYQRSFELPWPQHPDFPDYGYVVTRYELDQAVVERASEIGATILTHHEVIGATHEDGAITSLTVKNSDDGSIQEVRAQYYVLAEGSNARIARSLGVHRDRSEPMGLAIRGYYESPRSHEPWIESHMDLRDSNGAIMPGYGWIFPLGDGRVNVGFGLLSNSERWRSINTTEALARFVQGAPKSWGLTPKALCSPPTGGKLQMGHAIAPKHGSNYLIIGDAVASINPFNGEGISYAYETGKFAADIIARALGTDRTAELEQFDEVLRQEYGTYYRVARRFVRLISEPRVMGPAIWIAMRDQRLMGLTVRVMANLMRDQGKGLPEHLYGAVTKSLAIREKSPAQR